MNENNLIANLGMKNNKYHKIKRNLKLNHNFILQGYNILTGLDVFILEDTVNEFIKNNNLLICTPDTLESMSVKEKMELFLSKKEIDGIRALF